MLTVPYVTVPSFRAHPTFLDTMSLRPGDSTAVDQDRELFNILLMASAKADNYVEMSGDGQGTLTAHTRVEQTRVRVGRDGSVKYKPDHYPVTALTLLEWGTSPAGLTAVTDYSGTWIEKSRTIVTFLNLGVPGLGPAFQFGTPAVMSELYTRWTYGAGYANTTVAANTTVGATSFTVADPRGVAAGLVLRIWEPGFEEAVTVANTYVAGSSTVPVAGALTYAHTAGAGVSALPPDVHLAVIFYAVAMLLRPDLESEDHFPGTHMRPNTSAGGGGYNANSLVVEAERLLEVMRRVR